MLTTVHPTLNDCVYIMRPTCVVYIVWRHFILEPSTPFSQVPWSVLWLRHQLVTDVTAWLITPNLSYSKNRKKKKNKIKWKEKIKNEVHRQWSWQNTGYATINPYNFKPIFIQEQLTVSIQAIVLFFPSLYAATVVNLDTLHRDILSALSSDLIVAKYTSTDGQWSTDPNSLLLLDNRIYVPSAGNLCTCILQYNHNHILTRHFDQNKTLELVYCRYSWPSLHTDVQQFYKSCVTCMQFKPQCHKPYGSLKQLPISEQP